jgi:lipoprotein-anchoring transpeptidase ErfK/SrfK
VQTGDQTPPPELTPEKPAVAPTLTAEAGYRAVVLKWTAVENTSSEPDKKTNAADSYNVYLNGALAANTKDLTYTVSGLDPFTSYSFAVEAVNTAGTGPQATASKQPVRDIAYALKIKKSGTLKSHKGPKAKMKVKTGQTIYAYGFAGGKYMVRNGDSIFYVARTRVGKKSAIYDTANDYTREEAQNYINQRGTGSATGNLVWVSTWTQHIYLFTGSAGNWTCVDDWNISTGTASTPTPTGIDGVKTLKKKIKKKHNIKWWRVFHGTAALHGVKSNWGKKLGKVASNGCIRNPIEKAKVIYDLAKGTRLIIY